MKPARVSNAHYLPTLDGWRGIAILIVLLNHDVVHTFGPLSTAWIHERGRIGVDIFFALSGILICTRLLDEERLTGTLNLRNFYLRRLFRIQPAAWAYLLTIAVLMFCGVLDRGYAGIADSVLLVRNYLPLKFFNRDWYTGHFWSLSVEEHFYLLLPGFLVLVRRRRSSILFGCVVVLSIWQTLQREYRPLQFGWDLSSHTDVAIDGILIAAAFAVLLRLPDVRRWCEEWLHPWLALCLTLSLLVAMQIINRPVMELPLYCSYVLLIVSTMLHPATWMSRILEWPALRFLGRISYSVYLWQMLFFVHAHPIPPPHSQILATIQDSTPLRYAAAFLAALASYYLIERPCIRVGHRITSRYARHRNNSSDSSATEQPTPQVAAG